MTHNTKFDHQSTTIFSCYPLTLCFNSVYLRELCVNYCSEPTTSLHSFTAVIYRFPKWHFTNNMGAAIFSTCTNIISTQSTKCILLNSDAQKISFAEKGISFEKTWIMIHKFMINSSKYQRYFHSYGRDYRSPNAVPSDPERCTRFVEKCRVYPIALVCVNLKNVEISTNERKVWDRKKWHVIRGIIYNLFYNFITKG